MALSDSVSASSLLAWPGLLQNVSAEQIDKELAETGQAFACSSRENFSSSTQNSDHVPNGPVIQHNTPRNPIAELESLEQNVDDLIVANDFASWMVAVGDNNKNEAASLDIVDESEICERLGQLLRRHHPRSGSSLYGRIYEQEFLPTYAYLKNMLILRLRKSLRQADYPSKESCSLLIREHEEGKNGNFYQIAAAAEWLHRLRVEHSLVLSHAQGTSVVNSAAVDDVVLELCRPFVQRIRYHFVQSQVNGGKDRVERLPEWLFAYIREHIFPDDRDGPWELVHFGLAPFVRPDLSLDFVNEIIRLVQWVFAQRNVFRDPKLCGHHSQPTLLCSAIEQLLYFDDFVIQLTGTQSGRVLSLMDIYVAGDDEMLHWWLEREREAVFDILFHGKLENDLPNRVSPRAELFCSILRSIKRKATVFSFSGPYLSHVAAPLCMHFLDAVHASATNLKETLLNKRKLPAASDFQANIMDWVKLINGTRMSARLLIGSDEDHQMAEGTRSAAAHGELSRFGRSLERLEQVFIEEFATLFVEHLLLEKAKLANYLMRCSHLLSIDSGNTQGGYSELSPDLADAQLILNLFLEVVEEGPIAGLSLSSTSRDAIFYSSRALRDRVMTLVSEKFLEVALDWHGTTPDICLGGAQAFAADVGLLFGDSLLPPTGMRLLDVAKCLSMPSSTLSAMGDAMCGLAGQAPPLTEDLFAIDERVYEEAMSMICAKDILFIHLGDFLSVLNRRKDLSYISAF